MRIIFALIAALTLAGCGTSVGWTDNSKETLDKADVAFIGLPAPFNWLAFGMQGTKFPISDDLSITASHVAAVTLKRIVGQSPTCDVSIIKGGGKPERQHKLAYAQFGNKVRIYGYSAATGLPKVSEGMVANPSIYKGCTYYTIRGAGAMSGMSGGPVVDVVSGDTVGVVVAATTDDTDLVVFVPVQSFKNVLNTHKIPFTVRW